MKGNVEKDDATDIMILLLFILLVVILLVAMYA